MFVKFERAVTMIFDTDVIVWSLRGYISAARVINEANERALSVISYMELIQGARDKNEANDIRKSLNNGRFRILPLNENIGYRASLYIDHHALSNGLEVSDALVAATAIENQDILCSGNIKHFRPIDGLQLQPFQIERA